MARSPRSTPDETSPLLSLLRTLAIVRLDFIQLNFRRLLALQPQGHLIPMVKANAYGHGLVAVARALRGEEGILGFGVATLSEALALRDSKIEQPLLVFADGPIFDDTQIALYERNQITAVVHNLEDLKRIVTARAGFPFHVKVNTGMNRLGLEPGEFIQALPLLKKAGMRFEGIMTHFATAEEPSGRLARGQSKRFRAALSTLGAAVPRWVHACSTRALYEAETLGMDDVCNVARPGIGLYGYGLPKKAGLLPALLWQARVIRWRKLQKGDCVGYGATFRAARPQAEAVLAVGYGDGLPRILSNKSIAGRAVLGRLSMDLTAVDGTGLQPNLWVPIIGAPGADGDELAKAAGTIIYEILTSLSQRVPRVYHRDEQGKGGVRSWER